MTLGTRIKSILTQPRSIFNSILLIVFSANWIREVLYWLPKDAFGKGLSYWAFTDWLMDYSQGFIRRGLSGEILSLVPMDVSPLKLVAVFSWILILAVVCGYLRLVLKSWQTFHPLTLFGLLFLPSLFSFYLRDHNAIARKEILGYVSVLLHLLIVEKSFPLRSGRAAKDGNLQRYIRWLMPLAVILLPAIILIHEGNFLLFVPLHGMITMTILQMEDKRSFTRTILRTGLVYLPSVLAFGAVFLSGTPRYQALLGICKKWLATGAIREGSCVLTPDKLSGSTLPGAFIAMEWSLARAAAITRTVIPMNWEAWILILPVLGLSLWYLVRQALFAILRSRNQQTFSPEAAKRYTGLFFLKYFLIPLLLALPVYFTAFDYGRWFTVTCINYTLLAVSVNLPFREFAHLKKAADAGFESADSENHLDDHRIFIGISIIICVLAVVLWLPHYCLFSCEIFKSPLQFFAHTFVPR